MGKKNILVIEDEEKIASVIKLYLEKNDLNVSISLNGKSGLELFFKGQYSLVLLDLMLPDLSGEEICAEIRKRSNVPIIILTAKVMEESVINGFEIGADDYVTKPFSLKELLLRVKAVLRRSEKDDFENFIICGDLLIDTEKYEVYLNKELINLTPIEYKILLLLATNSKRVFTREEIIEAIYQYEFDGFDRAIDTHIKNIRKKLKDSSLIVTVHGIGYRIGCDKDG